MRPRTRLLSLSQSRDRGGFDLVTDAGGETVVFRAERVVLAMGKVGAAQESELVRALGGRAKARPMYVGVRLETADQGAEALFSSPDPKVKLHFSDGTKIKTHCAAQGGGVLRLTYDGLPVAGGHADHNRGSGRSSFGLLWDGIRDEAGGYAHAVEIMSRAAGQAGGKLVAQRLVDYMAGQPSRRTDVLASQPSTREWVAGDIRTILPDAYFSRMEAFIEVLSRRGADLLTGSTLLFAPAIEWWMNKVVTDDCLQTEVPGLYVAGDGAGWSQGIVHAAATGLLAAEGITGRHARIGHVRPLVTA